MIKAKKSLGQNFLDDSNVVKRIVESAELYPQDAVVEIGPGKGVLTEALAKKKGKVLAIELDDRLIPILKDKFSKKKNVEVFHGDILKINFPKLIEEKFTINEAKSYKVIANIPYYITAPIIRLLLETKYPPKEMYLMVQKEVAERIVAKPGNMSILAVSVQYYAFAHILFGVSRLSFDPMPQVDSAIIKIVVKGKAECGKEQTKKFFKLVRAGFAAKRKTLANNLASSFKMTKKEVESALENLGFTKNTRAQELSVEDWQELMTELNLQ
jgi:16S rRNA (adenine1518-N6/adenine1519-N6)-dimethyltransferase